MSPPWATTSSRFCVVWACAGRGNALETAPAAPSATAPPKSSRRVRLIVRSSVYGNAGDAGPLNRNIGAWRRFHPASLHGGYRPPTSGSAHGGVLYTGVSSPLSSAAGVDASLIQSSPLVKARDGLEGAAVAVHVPSPPRLEDPL